MYVTKQLYFPWSCNVTVAAESLGAKNMAHLYSQLTRINFHLKWQQLQLHTYMNIAVILFSVLSWTYQGTPLYFNGNTSVLNCTASSSCMLCCVCYCCHLHSSTKTSYFTASKQCEIAWLPQQYTIYLPYLSVQKPGIYFI